MRIDLSKESLLFWENEKFDIAVNWKCFSSEIAKSIFFKKKGKESSSCRPHLSLENLKNKTDNPVAVLLADPIVKFVAACHEDGVSFEEAICALNKGLYPSFHFLPQVRFLQIKNVPVYFWKAPDHIESFWKDLELGSPPILYERKYNIEKQQEDEVKKIYFEDFELFKKIKDPKTSFSKVIEEVNFDCSSFKKNEKNNKEWQVSSVNTFNNRYKICKSCENWDNIGGLKIGRCLKLGTFGLSNLMNACFSCPINKWGQDLV